MPPQALAPHPSQRRDHWGRPYPAFYILCSRYTHLSSGIRCLYLLCHHLNRLGYEAYVTRGGAPRHLVAPRADRSLIEANRRRGRDDIVVYPEVVAGNPLGGKKVVRYLLNKPGHIGGVGMAGYGHDDYFLSFAEEFVPEGLRAQALALPLVDRTVYHAQPLDRPRQGFVLYAGRHRADYSELPPWVTPRTIVSRDNARLPDELAALYCEHVALVVWERTAAVMEALHCACPVIAAPNEAYDPDPIVRRLGGCGIAVGWDREALDRARQTVEQAVRIYWERFRDLDQNIHAFVESANRHFATMA